MISSSSSVFPTRGADTYKITSPFLPDSVCIFLYSLAYRKAVLLAPRLISVRLSLHVVVILLCS